jgi:hypothetical protein
MDAQAIIKKLSDISKALEQKGLTPGEDFQTSTYEGVTILKLNLPDIGMIRTILLD